MAILDCVVNHLGFVEGNGELCHASLLLLPVPLVKYAHGLGSLLGFEMCLCVWVCLNLLFIPFNMHEINLICRPNRMTDCLTVNEA